MFKALVIGFAIIIFLGAGFFIYQQVQSPGDLNNFISYGQEIDLTGKGLTDLPGYVLNQTQIKKLILSDNSIKSLPSQIGQLKNVEELYLDNNLLEGALAAEIRMMKNLRILDVHNNNMTGIPAEIGQLIKLEKVDYSNNNLDTMPNEIENLKNNLKELNLSGNKYSQEKINEIKSKLPYTNIIY